MPIAREAILAALRAALEPLDYVHAMWEGGAAAFGRVDEWSDLDVQADADDDRAADVFRAVERSLQSLSPIALQYELPQPTWHGHAQTFYRLRDASEFLLVDFAVIRHSNPNKFLEPEIHGRAVVHFDKSSVTNVTPLDAAAFVARLRDRVEGLRVTFDLFQPLVMKEVHRGNRLEALAFYNALTLRPLVEALRIRHAPARYNFHTRYVYYDLPAGAVSRLEPLLFVGGAAEIPEKRREAERFFHETVGGIRWEDVAARLAAN